MRNEGSHETTNPLAQIGRGLHRRHVEKLRGLSLPLLEDRRSKLGQAAQCPQLHVPMHAKSEGRVVPALPDKLWLSQHIYHKRQTFLQTVRVRLSRRYGRSWPQQ